LLEPFLLPGKGQFKNNTVPKSPRFDRVLRWKFLDLESDQLSSGSAQAQALKFVDNNSKNNSKNFKSDQDQIKIGLSCS